VCAHAPAKKFINLIVNQEYQKRDTETPVLEKIFDGFKVSHKGMSLPVQ
jgi:hypothetical protein